MSLALWLKMDIGSHQLSFPYPRPIVYSGHISCITQTVILKDSSSISNSLPPRILIILSTYYQLGVPPLTIISLSTAYRVFRSYFLYHPDGHPKR